MRLIDGGKLQEFPIRANHCDKEHANTHFINGIESVMEYAEQLPTVDAEVVVRCKDCKHSWEDLGGLTCSHGVCVDCVVLGDFYCANGERKKGADNG